MIRLAIVNDYDLVVAGVAAMLSEERDRIQVTALDADATQPRQDVDVVLYDTFGPAHSSMDYLEALVDGARCRSSSTRWNAPTCPQRSKHSDAGQPGYLSKALTGSQIADAIEAVVAGAVVVSPDVRPGRGPGQTVTGRDARART